MFVYFLQHNTIKFYKKKSCMVRSSHTNKCTFIKSCMVFIFWIVWLEGVLKLWVIFSLSNSLQVVVVVVFSFPFGIFSTNENRELCSMELLEFLLSVWEAFPWFLTKRLYIKTETFYGCCQSYQALAGIVLETDNDSSFHNLPNSSFAFTMWHVTTVIQQHKKMKYSW